jgi:hypothetical protein
MLVTCKIITNRLIWRDYPVFKNRWYQFATWRVPLHEMKLSMTVLLPLNFLMNDVVGTYLLAIVNSNTLKVDNLVAWESFINTNTNDFDLHMHLHHYLLYPILLIRYTKKQESIVCIDSEPKFQTFNFFTTRVWAFV